MIEKKPKKLYIETLGCAMNVRDTEHIIAELGEKDNYETTNNSEEADLIIINTCSVREKPVSKLFSELGVYNIKKKDGAKIGVAGCTASHLGADIIKKAPYVNFVLGARNISKISDVVNRDKAVEINIDYDESTYHFASKNSTTNIKSLINISIGCDKKCSYCIVPQTRGKEISIPSKIIIDEVKKAVDRGAKEILLLGQNVNGYGKRFTGTQDEIDFSDLLTLVSKVDGIERIRFTSPHPLHMDDKFLEVFANNEKLAKHMHMPLQSGSTKILRDMKRGYTKEWFLDRAYKLREMVKDVTIGTDIIVGFPGESDEDFADTLDVMNKVNFEQIFSFKYSPRPNTTALELADEVDAFIATERLSILQNIHKDKQKLNHQNQIGRNYKLLVEDLSVDGEAAGKCENFYGIVIPNKNFKLGDIVPVRVTGIVKGMLRGEAI